MSILQRQSAIGIPQQLDALLVVGVTLLCTAAPLLPSNAAIAAASGILVLAVLAWYKRCPAAAPFSIFCVVCLSLIFSGMRYFPVVLALGLLGYAGVVRGVPWLRGTATWAQWGSFGTRVCLLSVGAWLVAAVALLSWYLLLHPNIADIVKAYVPASPLGLLMAGGLIFAVLNAAVEEAAYRGVVLHALDRSLGPGFAALLLQAAAFGAIHIRGFPRGWLGVGLASIFGLFMGVIRRRAGGMFAPWIAHVFTDVVIAGIVLLLARSERPNQAMQRTASQRTTHVLSVCHPAVGCESRFTGLAVADLVSR
ncbi:MAG TPA: CPBP family intramembrane glutamic endopeptidase [Candidatus Limnocylindrales bacterium]|nr:CPBP family intramembrane glutamic endopeptidase [Candidatus Limnocylindrales bacterium]